MVTMACFLHQAVRQMKYQFGPEIESEWLTDYHRQLELGTKMCHTLVVAYEYCTGSVYRFSAFGL